MNENMSENLSRQGQFGLLRERRFAPFFWTQFMGALNDNIYKNSLVILLTYHAASITRMDANTLVNLSAGLFILPFFIFSATSGQLADKYEKGRIIRYVKLFEIGIMVIGAVGLHLHSLALLLTALFLMGLHSTLFGPVKYAILPQHLRPEELVGGNGVVESGTFLAILIGTIGAGLLASLPGAETWVSAVVILVAISGWLASRLIPYSPAPSPELAINWNPITETWRNLAFTRGNRTVFLSILGVSWFWFYGALFLSQFPSYSKDVLGGNEHVVTLLLTVFSIGVGTGSLLCERLSARSVEIGLVPFGSIGLTLFGVDIYFASPGGTAPAAIGVTEFLRQTGSWRIVADLVLIGMFGGFYIVPLYALIQSRSEVEHRSRVIAGNNILNALFMVAAAVMAVALIKAGLSVPQLLLVTALLNALVAVYIYTLVPEFLIRFLVWILVHTVYRLEKTGLEHIPEQGPAILVSNHVTLVDALVIAAACPRPIRFVLDWQVYRAPLLRRVFQASRAIPIPYRAPDEAPYGADGAADGLGVDGRAYEEIARALAAGQLVCLFPEGGITDSGEMCAFGPELGRILQRTSVPVVPIALRGLWGSLFSLHPGGRLRRLPGKLFARIGLVAAPALDPLMDPAGVSPDGLRQRILELRGEMR